MKGGVLTIHEDYFLLTGGIERWLYRVARKHAGHQETGWQFTMRSFTRNPAPRSRFSDFALDVRKVVELNSPAGIHRRDPQERGGRRDRQLHKTRSACRQRPPLRVAAPSPPPRLTGHYCQVIDIRGNPGLNGTAYQAQAPVSLAPRHGLSGANSPPNRPDCRKIQPRTATIAVPTVLSGGFHPPYGLSGADTQSRNIPFQQSRVIPSPVNQHGLSGAWPTAYQAQTCTAYWPQRHGLSGHTEGRNP